ncbi:MAG: NAD(P)H-binding protein [Chitinophagaceae bacterium]
MKNIIVIGASGSLAGPVIKELVKLKDVHLTLFLRNKARLPKQNLSDATVVEGDVMNYQVC